MPYGDSRTVPRKRRPKVRAKPPSSGSRGSGAAPRGKGSQPISTPSPAPSKPKPYVRPRIERQPGPVSDKERTKIRRATGEQRLAPKSQPGPSSDRERRKVRKAKKQRAYQQAQKAARRAGRREDKRQLLRTLGASVGGRADTDTKVLGVNVEAELEGRGGIQKAAEFVKKKVATSETAKHGLRSAGVPVPQGKLGTNVLKDAVDIPAQAVPSAYAVGAAATEAVQGRPERGKQLWKDFKEHDPLALAAQGKFDKAAKEAEKHPLLTAASVSGVGSVASRGVGAGIRASGAAASHVPSRRVKKAGRVLKRAGTTKREPRVAPGTGITEPRRYSKGAVGKAAQVTHERVQARGAKKLRVEARQTRDPQAKAALRVRAAQKDPKVLSERDIARRVDEREAMAEVRRRTHRSRALKEVDKALPRERADIALLLAQGVVKADRASLQGFARNLDTMLREGSLSKSQRAATRKLRRQVKDALSDKKLDLPKLKKTADAYAKVSTPRQRGLVERGILDPQAERMAKLIPVAVREMGAKWNHKANRLELDGHKLPVSRIERFLRSTGRDPDDIAYVTQAPGQRGARNFFSSWHEPKGIASTRRTGEATRKGSLAVDREVGRENVARQQGLTDAFDEYAGFVGENAFRKGGRTKPKPFPDRKSAEEFARSELADHPYEWVPVPTRPQFGRSEQSKALLDQADAQDVGLSRGVRKGIEDALEGEGSGQFVLVPEAAAGRSRKHSRLLGSTGTKITRKLGRQFSGTVLTTSGITWPIGNIVEASLRNTIARAGPASLALGHKTVKKVRELDPDLADELEARIGTGHLGAYELNNIHATADAFRGTAMAPVARGVGAFARAPGPKQLAQLWNGWTKAIFAGNGFLEHQFRVALLGRHLRDEGYSPKKLALKEGTRALSTAAEQAARGLTDTNEQVAAARFIRRAYGQYEAWGPDMRFTIAVFTPFVAWSLNSVRFLGQVLPRDHPVLTGLIASAERATEEWRNEYGLGKHIDGAAPNWMQAAVPWGGQLHPLGRYTPFGFWSDPLEAGGGLVLPQFRGMLNATQGLDWKGDPIAGHDRAGDATEAERAKELARVAAGAFVPFFGLQERVREKGAKTVLNPARGYDYNRDLSAAFEGLGEVEEAKTRIRDKRPNVDSDNPTPRYERLHRRTRKLNRRIYRESKGAYGQKYKEPYQPKGSSGGAGSDNAAKELIAP